MFLPFTAVPAWVQSLAPHALWQMPPVVLDPATRVDQLPLYLTFDDGPIPYVTPWVIEQLAAYQAKATFFCVGENVARHRPILDDLIAHGHTIGNHTYRHLNGWRTSLETYADDVENCHQLLQTRLFRPPYGKLTPPQSHYLQKKGFQIVMWSILSFDFETRLSPQWCLQNVCERTQAGSVIVFHDSLKAWPILQYALPRLLDHYTQKGYTFAALPPMPFLSV